MEHTILDSIPDLNNLKSFTDRYFSKRYIVNVNGTPNNDIMKDGSYKINFNIGKVDRLTNTVKGKGKRGGQMLLPTSTICKVEYADGTSFDIPCCMKGTLVEVNEELVKCPELLKEMPDSNGYIAIMLSSIAISEATKNEMLTPEDYANAISSN